MIWFTGDHHFSHKNIIEYSKRPFKSIEHMNMEMIRRWNSVVKPNDTVFHLGDILFENKKLKFNDLIEKLNGKIILIHGNHDRWKWSPIKNLIIQLQEREIYLSHEPEFVCELNLCCHIHERWKMKAEGRKRVLNVGVDVWDFTPITLDTILKAIWRIKK